MESLWPDFSELQKVKSPKEILEEQGGMLPKATNQLVFAVMEASDTFKNDISVGLKYDFTYDFNICGKGLPSYRFKLLTVGHNINLYPARIRLESDLRKEAGITKQDILVESQTDFINLLKDVFGSSRLKYIVTSIMSMADGSK